MKRFFLAASIASFVLASCGSESTSTDSTDTNITTDSNMITPSPDTTNNSLPPVGQDSVKPTSSITMPPASLPVSNTQPAVSLPSTSVKPVNTQPANVAAGLNPEHGKPGHRCDIAVGAPLNSPPSPTALPSNIQATPVPTPATTAAPTAAPTGPKPKLNPAHGQPYHDCSIKVGDPLKN